MTQPLLDIRDLSVVFDTEAGLVQAVDHVSFTVEPRETLCLVGESGCGKSVTCHSILRLHPPNARITSGSILLEQQDLLALPAHRLNHLRGSEVAMVFQDPIGALNPVHTIGNQIVESLQLHRDLAPAAARDEAVRLLDVVGIPAPRRRLRDYPHQLSGGMCQRAMIAMALACRPKLLIADEPTTALDVTIQAQILELLAKLQDEFGMSIVLITHDLGIVAEIGHRVVVMYSGRVVERGTVAQVFAQPTHPYTVGLLDSLPRVDRDIDKLALIQGTVPSPHALPAGCHFAPRCRNATAECHNAVPSLEEVRPGQMAACFHPQGVA